MFFLMDVCARAVNGLRPEWPEDPTLKKLALGSGVRAMS